MNVMFIDTSGTYGYAQDLNFIAIPEAFDWDAFDNLSDSQRADFGRRWAGQVAPINEEDWNV